MLAVRRIAGRSVGFRPFRDALERLRVGWELVRSGTLALPVIGVASAATAAGARSGAAGLAATGHVALGGLALTLLNAGSNALNQVCDVTADRINKPRRPLPGGRASVPGALGLAVSLYAAALGAAWGVGQGLRTKIAKMGKVGRHSLDRDPDEFSEKPGVF